MFLTPIKWSIAKTAAKEFVTHLSKKSKSYSQQALDKD